MRIHICGARGSTSAPGAEFLRYGGHTSCVAICSEDGVPRLVLDAGTGLRRLSTLLGGTPFRGTILLSHLHWDHTHGLPFFESGDNEGARVRLLMPVQPVAAAAALGRCMSPPHFPIGPGDLLGEWSFEHLEPGGHELEGFSVLALEIPHKGGTTYGYRVGDGQSTIAYLPDHSPTSVGAGPDALGDFHDAACALADGVDLLIHDAQYTAGELRTTRRGAFGHSAVEYAVELGRRCGVGTVLLFHHDPSRTDDEIDLITRECQGRGVRVEAAAEGAILEVMERGSQRAQ